MPDTIARVVPHVPPRLVISRPFDERSTDEISHISTTTNSAGRRKNGSIEPSKPTSEWIDVDDSQPRRRRRKKRSSQKARQDSSSSSGIASSYRQDPNSSEQDLERFVPRLNRIPESRESLLSSRSRSKRYDSPRDRSSTPSRRSRDSDNASVSYRRPVRHRYGSLQRRAEGIFDLNPSLLSVLSGLTSASDRSSGSNSTVTQSSYDRRGSDSQTTPTGKPRRSEPGGEPTLSRSHRSPSPGVLDYMPAPSVEDDRDDMSDTTSSSQYEPSDAGSSEAPATPSSRSTLPSPTTTRRTSVAELRRKYDPSLTTSNGSARSNSPAHSLLSLQKQRSVAEAVEEEDEDEDEDEDDEAQPQMEELEPPRRLGHGRERRSSRSSSHGDRRLRQQEEAMRQHVAANMQPQYGYHPYPQPPQHRSPSMSSTGSGRDAAYAHQMALQQYQWPSPPSAPGHLEVPHHPSGHVAHAESPPAPEPPDLSQKTLAGYELLASELAAPDSSVTPMYRRFSHLNHRVLLHLQDELAELEEQLRILDEIIAQNDPALAEGHYTPASRRGDARSAHEIFHHRKFVLGQIYVKSEQYNRYLASYNAVAKDMEPAPQSQIEKFRQWMAKYTPVIDLEARFLQHDADLVVPCQSSAQSLALRTQTVLAYAPVLLLVPLLLFSFVPSLVGRLVVTSLLAAAVALVACSTRLKDLLSHREWSICGAAYLALMAAVAALVPYGK